MKAASITPLVARIVDKSDGHGAQFEIHLDGATPDLIQVVKGILDHGGTLYLDGARVEGKTLVLSLCRGAIVLAMVDHRWNSGRTDQKCHVVLREEMETNENPNLPEFTERR